MRRTPADILGEIRPLVLEELLASRGTIDHVHHEMDHDELRAHLDALLAKLQVYLGDRDPRSFRSYLRRWVAMRVAAGSRHENLIPALVGVGDTAIEIARTTQGDTDETRAVMRALAQANFLAARMVVEVLADELERRRTQVVELSDPEAPTRV
ncbi:MAG: hypothetical protein KJO07_19000 [Deltaproteobacteria bacterium]|nr:hypothetical protein [Deltaproteobacteria bacterium]